jgi:hypothetical protein
LNIQKEKVIESQIKLRNRELHYLCASPNIIRTNKSGMMRWAGHVAGMRDNKNSYKILVGRTEGKRICLEFLGVD